MSQETIYDLAVLLAATLIIVAALLLTSFASLDQELAVGALGLGAGVFAVRSGRATLGRGDASR